MWGLLGCHPSAPPLSVFVDLRAALGHVDCCARNMRAVVGDCIVTSTVRIKLREVCNTLLLTVFRIAQYGREGHDLSTCGIVTVQ